MLSNLNTLFSIRPTSKSLWQPLTGIFYRTSSFLFTNFSTFKILRRFAFTFFTSSLWSMDGTLIANKDLVYRSYTYPNDTFHMIDKSRILGLGGGLPGGSKMAPFLYALTSSNINRFLKLFHCQNQEKICNNTITKDPTTPQVCRYPTLWNSSVLKATIENQTTSVTTHFKEINNREPGTTCMSQLYLK